MIIKAVTRKFSKWQLRRGFFAVMLLSVQFLLIAQPSIISDSELYDTDKAAISVVKFTTLREINLADELRIQTQEGLSSHYGRKFHNRKTANGERYKKDEYSAAHKTLPFGTIVKVTNLSNGLSTLVRINDRGPFVKKRIIDLSFKSAEYIQGTGLASVKTEYFVPGMIAIPDDSKYFFGYSLNLQPVIIPDNSVTIIDSTNNFNDAVNLYKQNLHLDSDVSRFFLLVEANEVCGKQTENSDFYYYIGYFDGKIFKKKSGIVAEKVN